MSPSQKISTTSDLFGKTCCFLVLKKAETEPDDVIKRWETCYSDSSRVSHMTTESEFEKPLIKGLLTELFGQCQRNIVLVTFSEQSIPLLRKRIVFHDINNVTFQGIEFISLQELLNTYFSIKLDKNHDAVYHAADQLNIPVGDEQTEAELVRSIFRKIVQLIPQDVIN